MIEMPPALEAAWHTHGYYGSVSHNVKAIYQRYLGWFDGNPAHLWQHPPVEAAHPLRRGLRRRRRGRSPRPRATSTTATCASRPSCSTTSCSPTRRTPTARELLAGRLRARSATAPRTAPGATSTCRAPTSCATASQAAAVDSAGAPDMVGALTVDQLFDSLAIRVNGPKAWDEHLTIDWVFTDLGHTYRHRADQRRAHPGRRPDGRRRRPHRHAHQAAAPRPARRRRARRHRDRRRPRCRANGCSPCSTRPTRLRHRHPVAGASRRVVVGCPKECPDQHSWTERSARLRSAATRSRAARPAPGPCPSPDRIHDARGEASVPEIRYVCLSDLHLGAANSVLTNLDDAGEHVAGPGAAARRGCSGACASCSRRRAPPRPPRSCCTATSSSWP